MIQGKTIIKKRTYFVARLKQNKFKYAVDDGQFIENVSFENAKRANSPAGLMYGFLGGHYSGYDAIKVTEIVKYQEEKVNWPPEDEVFDR